MRILKKEIKKRGVKGFRHKIGWYFMRLKCQKNEIK